MKIGGKYLVRGYSVWGAVKLVYYLPTMPNCLVIVPYPRGSPIEGFYDVPADIRAKYPNTRCCWIVKASLYPSKPKPPRNRVCRAICTTLMASPTPQRERE